MQQEQPRFMVKRSAFEEFSHLPYFRNIPKDSRIAFLNPLYDEENSEWVLLYPAKPDKLIRLQGGEPVQSCYMSFRAVDDIKDFELSLGTFVIQHLSFPGVLGAFFALETDFHNFAAVLEKYLLITVRDKTQREGNNLLLRTELEYLISSIRSVYDQLQKLSKHAASLVVNLREPEKRLIANLPESFSDIVLNGDEIRTAQQIQEKYRLPEPLAVFYASEVPHFKWLRKIRVSIEHHGKTLDTIFDLDDGAAVDTQSDLWRNLPLWQEAKFVRSNSLGSLHLVFCFLVDQVIEMTNRYVTAFTQSVNVIPEAIEPGIKIFIRNQFSNHLVSLKDTLQNPWERLQS